METIGSRIKHLRDSKGLSMGKLEKAINASGGSVDKWEKNKSMPGGEALIRLSNFFSVSVDWILKGEVSVNNSVNLPPSDVELLAKFHQLGEREQAKIEGMIEGLLMATSSNVPSEMSSSRSTNTDDRDDAATKQAI